MSVPEGASASGVLELEVVPPSALHGVQGWLARQAVKGWLPLRRSWPPAALAATGRTGRLSLELVSHCWNYSHLLECQLGSLVAAPPRAVDVTMTVYHSLGGRQDRSSSWTLAARAEGPRGALGLAVLCRASSSSGGPSAGTTRRSPRRRTGSGSRTATSSSPGAAWMALGAALQGRTDPLVYPAFRAC